MQNPVPHNTGLRQAEFSDDCHPGFAHDGTARLNLSSLWPDSKTLCRRTLSKNVFSLKIMMSFSSSPFFVKFAGSKPFLSAHRLLAPLSQGETQADGRGRPLLEEPFRLGNSLTFCVFFAWSEHQRTHHRHAMLNEHSTPSWSFCYRAWRSQCFASSHSMQNAQSVPEQGKGSGMRQGDWRNVRRLHLIDQYHDRLIYYTSRCASRSKLGILVLTIDSLDKGKKAFG